MRFDITEGTTANSLKAEAEQTNWSQFVNPPLICYKNFMPLEYTPTFLIAEIAIPRKLFETILRRIGWLRLVPATD